MHTLHHRWLVGSILIAGFAWQPFVDASAQSGFVSPIDVIAQPADTTTSDDADATPAPAAPSPLPSETPEPIVVPKAIVTPPPATSSGSGGVGAPSRASDKAGYSYSYAIDDRRFNDTTIASDTYKPLGNPNSRFRPYVAAYVARDSRTTPGTPTGGGPAVPLIYSDNYGVIAAGIQYTTPQGLRVFLQGGGSRTVGPVAAQPSGGDLRGGVQLYREWGPTYAHASTYGNFYGSASYLSRYSDSIFYNQLEIVHNVGSATHPLEPFVRAVYTADTRTFYYSNTAELTAGIRYHPLGVSGPIVSLEALTGRYLRGALPIAEPRTYTDLRPTISFGFNL